MTELPEKKATVIDEAYMEKFTNDQLAYKAWAGSSVAVDILFDDELRMVEDCVNDARFEVACSQMALRVLVRRLTGMDASVLREAINTNRIDTTDFVAMRMPGETLQ
ncbi:MULTISPECIES: hypothetical protein [Pseudomonas syringae group]|uniref:hypothetical protein n=1 Tax=Pseudomonas syringae group TaxID=136849 RepID=UPI0001873818|nr:MULTISPECIES: hypothetical protein [Pseudomonas syringae group]EEB61262.1 hypothetical protein PSPTOT1_3757 [Pseudomonas syringae pv. tomato T1]KGK96178.1 hypothetical protein NB04_06855 [Pseudomonas syringae pv. tomato]MBM1212841.1 hypothetical protein [Pseudomonas syringae]MBM1218489.1 hypothetical protein [Pseudomonas syringae]MBX6404101.1 hypothetical protein [Pseudomonas syringae pv. tomato]